MSGECDNCGEHALECWCKSGRFKCHLCGELVIYRKVTMFFEDGICEPICEKCSSLPINKDNQCKKKSIKENKWVKKFFKYLFHAAVMSVPCTIVLGFWAMLLISALLDLPDGNYYKKLDERYC